MHQAKRIAKNTGFLYVRLAITVFISLYSTRLVLNALGAENFGIFNVVGGVIVMLTFLNVAMAGASQRFMSIAQGEGNLKTQKQIFNVSLILHLCCGIIVILFLEIAGHFLFGEILKIEHERLFAAKLIFHFMVISTFFTIISVPYDAILNAHENMLFVAVMGVFESLLKLSAAIYITYSNYDKLISYGIWTAGISILMMVIQRIYCHYKYEEVEVNLNKFFDKILFREMTKFAGWSFLGTSSSMLSNYGQGIVMNIFFGSTVNAAQGVANQISGQLSVFAATMMKALNPSIARNEGAGKREMMIKTALVGSKLSFFLLMIFCIPILIEMRSIFNLWLNDVPEYAVIFCRLILLRIIIEQPFQSLITSISAVGNIRKFQIYNSILNLLPLIATYILFEMGYKPYVNYIVFIIYSLIGAFIILYFSKKYCGISLSLFSREVLSRCSSVFLITITISSIPVFFMESNLTRIILVFFLSSISFLTITWHIGFSTTERQEILHFIWPKI